MLSRATVPVHTSNSYIPPYNAVRVPARIPSGWNTRESFVRNFEEAGRPMPDIPGLSCLVEEETSGRQPILRKGTRHAPILLKPKILTALLASMATPPPPAGTGEPDINHGPRLFAATAVVTIFALVAVCTRLWVRKVMIKSVGWDDVFMVAAMILSLVAEGLTIADVYYGAGRHAAYLTDPDKHSYGLFLNFVSQPFYLVGVVLVKVSIGLFLVRITPSVFFNRFIWSMQAFMCIYTTIALITIFTQCRPLSVIWDHTVTEAICFTPLGLRACAYFNAACGIFADLVFALIPIPMLWNVRINTQVKAALFGILSLGLLYVKFFLDYSGHDVTLEERANMTCIYSATAACIVKVVYLTSYGKYNDFLWDSVDITIWTSCELNIGIFAASIATLKPLFRATFRGSSLSKGYTNGTKDQRSMDKSGFVKHISNHQGENKIGDGSRSHDDDFEMYGNVVTTNKKRGVTDMDSESQEIILPFQNPGIMKTTQVNVSVSDVRTKKYYDDAA
ncbi:uncharacterized protein BP5553_05018 [Venustampulla echinocandica]|uniref:Rhodopsin domain-containing protein n=1 Tax=Venustampulla echinocandica TaxID=2656787 RepID=A0A370TPX8_9HELO|nr:uncharacterized protein BP5553_05018 [Venustampulla echinocandica]RDL37585.1 hypothetical protein BP5553_05018 [Venustampulla echinocandica]